MSAPHAPGRFTTGSPMRHVAVMTLSGAVGLTLMFLVDAATLFYIARLGDDALTAAVGYAWTVQFFIVSLGLAASIAATALVSRAIGERDLARARRAASSSFVITCVALALVSALAVAFRYPLLRLLGAEGEALEAGASFLMLSGPSMPLMGVAMIGGSVMRAQGDAARSMLPTLGSGLTSLILDPLLIFHAPLGLEIGAGWGIEGAAIAMTGARAVSCAIGLWGVVHVHKLAARPTLAGVLADLKPILAVAGPATLTQASTPAANFLLTGAVAAYGDGAVAGWSVITRLSVLAFGGIFALSASVGGIIGQNYGAGDMARVRRAYRDAALFCALYVVAAWALLALLGDAAIAAFALPADGAALVSAFVHLAAGGFVFMGWLFVANAAFNVMGRPIYASAVNWARDGVATPVCIWLLGGFGATGPVYAQGLAGAVCGCIALWLGWRFTAAVPAPRPLGAPAWRPAPAMATSD